MLLFKSDNYNHHQFKFPKTSPKMFISFVMAVLLIAAAIVPSSVALADSATMKTRATAYFEVLGLRNCLGTANDFSSGTLGGTISVSDANSGTWFASTKQDKPVNGYASFLPYSTEGTSCNEIVQNLASFLGYGTNYGQFLIDILHNAGYSDIDTSSSSKGIVYYQTDAPDGYNQRSKMQTAVQDMVVNEIKKMGDMDNSGWWYMYASAFFSGNGCNAQQDDKGSYEISTIKSNGKSQTLKYAVSGNPSFNIYYGQNANKHNSWSGISMSCQDIATNMQSSFSALKLYIGLHKNEAADVVNLVNTNSSNKNSGTDNSTSSCSSGIGGIGWLVCPFMNFFSGVLDGVFDTISSLLKINVTAITNSATQNAWQYMRNIANILFIIGFLIIILSQVTGIGIDNYGVKKLLPKLIITVILVNLSYVICSIAVDLSNIIGVSIKDLLSNIAVNGYSSGSGSWTDVISNILAGVGIVTGVTLGLLALSIPVILSALLAVLMVLLILAARQAIIVILIVAAPLAFVLFLLPNTEKWFKNWSKIFVSLLLIYPMIGFVYGASIFVSKVLMVAANGDLMMQLVALGAKVLPLLITPKLLQSSLDATGEIGKMASGISAKRNAAVGKNVKERSSLGTAASGISDYRKRSHNIKLAKRRATFAKDPTGGMIANVLGGKNYAARVMAEGAAIKEKEEKENIEAAAIRLRDARLNQGNNRAVALGGASGSLSGRDFATRSAAIQKMVASNDVIGMNQLWEQAREGNLSDDERRVFADSLSASSGRPAYFGAGAIDGMRVSSDGMSNTGDLMMSAVKSGAYSPAKIAAADKDELYLTWKQAVDTGNQAAAQILYDNSTAAFNDDRIRPTIGKNGKIIDTIRNGNNVDPADMPQ